jgi:hypothetical protein
MLGGAWLFDRTDSLGVHPNVFGDWILNIALMLAFVIIVGDAITNRWSGVLIDDRNRMSLSRFQLLSWTLIVVPGVLAIAASRVLTAASDPLAVGVPQEVWALLGISSASLVGSPIIQSYKAKQQPSDVVLAAHPAASHKGVLVANATAAQAEWTNLFSGEELGDSAFVDLGKVQMFFFTLVIGLVYAGALGAALWNQHQGASFPPMSQGMLVLLGISHAAYLTNKAVPHTQT